MSKGWMNECIAGVSKHWKTSSRFLPKEKCTWGKDWPCQYWIITVKLVGNFDIILDMCQFKANTGCQYCATSANIGTVQSYLLIFYWVHNNAEKLLFLTCLSSIIFATLYMHGKWITIVFSLELTKNQVNFINLLVHFIRFFS